MTEQNAFEDFMHLAGSSAFKVDQPDHAEALNVIAIVFARYRKALEHIASGTERGGMQTVIAQCALNPGMNTGGDLSWLESEK